MSVAETAESARLGEVDGEVGSWRRFGPYLSDRAWASVREDYSSDGSAWSFFPHDQARSRAYRWGEDGIGGFCDRYQVACLAFAFWNGRDPILKERFFGVVPSEGNHGEDVKEYYFHVDGLPSHAYMKLLYKYPQREYPYSWLVQENQRRSGQGPEFELIDTGIFDDDRYFDIVIEWAKWDTEDLGARVTVWNRGPEAAPIHVLPHLWFRNTWAFGAERSGEPRIELGPSSPAATSFVLDDTNGPPIPEMTRPYRLGRRYFYADAGGTPLFTDNESNPARVPGARHVEGRRFFKDAFHRLVVNGEQGAVNPEQFGTKAAVHYQAMVPPGESVSFRIRLAPHATAAPLQSLDALIATRKREADEFYRALHPPQATDDEKLVQRQALAGLLWNKQLYMYDVNKWLEGDDRQAPPPEERKNGRNSRWKHLNSRRILSMPDSWEYPWFAAWDQAFQSVAFALIDPAFAKEQLWYLLFEQFQHPSGQIPACEWEFSDLNPPVHAWAVFRVYNMERTRTGAGDRAFLEACFHKLLINFAWWVNKVDAEGNNIFEGGFLGLDNIALVDRSEHLPDGVVLEQSDASGWMAMFSLNLMRIALELARQNPVYEGLATKFFQHYLYIAAAMKKAGGADYQLWDEDDGFFYDVLRHPDGRFEKFRVRSLVGLIPLYAIERLEDRWSKRFTGFQRNLEWVVTNKQNIVQNVCYTIHRGEDTVHVLAIVDPAQMRRLLERVFDPREFMAPHGMRSLSRYHLDDPFAWGGRTLRYEPAESETKIKGGNSNWRGPIWFPTAFLMVESLRKIGVAFQDSLLVPTLGTEGDPRPVRDLAGDLANRMIGLFTRDGSGRRPVYGGIAKFQDDPHWRDLILFYEFFHGETGQGLGASHQTGWTALVANLIDEWRRPPQPSAR